MSEEHVRLESLTETDRRLIALFDELEMGQLDFLDKAGKRLIELATALIGVLFAITTFGDGYPPPYLKDSNTTKVLAIVTLAFYVLTMLMGMLAIQPRKYPRYPHNLDKMREVFDSVRDNKMRWLTVGGVLFWLGSVALAILVVSVIYRA